MLVLTKMTRRTLPLRAAAAFVTPVGLVVFPPLGALAFLGFLSLSRQERPWPLSVPSLTLVVALLISALVSPWPLQALQGVLGALAIGLVLVLLSTRLQPADRPAALFGLAAGLAVFGLKAVYDVFVAGAPRATGFTFHANIAAGLMLTGCLALLGGLSAVRRTLPRLLLLAGLLGGLAALALSGSRGAYFGLGAGLVAFVLVQLYQGKGRKLAVLLAIGVAAALAVGLEPLLDLFLRRADLVDDPLNPMGRTFMWLLALELAAQRPFLGYGFGAWRELIPIIEPTFPVESLQHSHNLYLQLLLDGGSLSLVAFISWLCLIGLQLLGQARRGNLMATSALAVLIGVAAHNLLDVTLYQAPVAGLLWLSISLGLVRTCGKSFNGPSRDNTERHMDALKQPGVGQEP